MSFQNNNNNKISSLMNRLDQNLTDLSSLNSNYSPNNYLDNRYQNNFADFHTQNLYEANNQDEFNFASESNEEDEDDKHLNKNILLEMERKRRKALEVKLRNLQLIMKKQQLTMSNDNLYKKISDSLENNSLQSRRFKGDGSEDDYLTHQLNQQKTNLLSKSKLNYQNNSNNLNRNNRFNSLDRNLDNGYQNDYSINNNLKKIDRLIKIIKQQQDDGNQLSNKNMNCVNNFDFANELNGNSMKKIKNNLSNNLGDNQSLNSLDIGNLLNLSNLSNSSNLSNLSNQYSQSNENFFHVDDDNLKQIIHSMKSNLNSMIEFIDNQTFSQDNNFALIQQLTNLIMMQNCQFMNHQQVLLSLLQRLQFQLSSNVISRLSGLSRDNLIVRNQINDHLFIDNKFNDQLSNANLKHLSSLNNNETNVKTSSNNFDNLKSNSFYQNQFNSINNNLSHFNNTNSLPFQNNNTSSNMKMRNLKFINKLSKNADNSPIAIAPNEFNELCSLIDKIIEDKSKSLNQNATGSNYQEFEEQGAVGGTDSKIELSLSETANNLSSKLSQQNNSTNSNLVANNLNNGSHLTNGTNCSTANNLNININSSSNKSPQILHLPSNSSSVRKKPVNPTRKNPDVIESINLPDDLIKNSETIRPLMAAEGRSSEFINPAPSATNILQSKIINNSKINTSNICSTSSINSNSITNSISNPPNQSTSNPTNSHCLLKRPPTTGASRNINNNFDRNNENDTETSDDDLTSNQNQTSPEINSSENENNLNNLQSAQLPSNGNRNSTVAFVENSFSENHNLDNEQQIDEHFAPGTHHLNNRNDDSEIRFSGDGEQC